VALGPQHARDGGRHRGLIVHHQDAGLRHSIDL
jgi:hypothetical protein